MGMKNKFEIFLEKGWAEGTVRGYISAINIISNDLLRHKLIQNNIYDIDDIKVINDLLNLSYLIPNFDARNENGNKRYSNGIKRYIEFYNLINNKKTTKVKEINNDRPEFLDLLSTDQPKGYPIDNIDNIEYIDDKINLLEREIIIKSRIGQSNYRKSLMNRYKSCLVCGISDKRFLIASHIKPWAESENNEKLDIDNGLLLCVHHDALFDKNLISFTDRGSIIISDEVSKHTQQLLNINENTKLKIELNNKTKKYLKVHREKLLKK